MTYEQLLSELKQKKFKPIYLLTGDEPYYIDQLVEFFEKNILSDSEKEFNQTIVYGKDTSPETLVSYAKRYPMMSPYQVIILKEAQEMKNLEKGLENYITSPLQSTLLVIAYKHKSPDKRKAFYKKLSKTGLLFESKKLYDNKIPGWISSYIETLGYSITPKAALLIADHLGTNLSKVTNEISKLLINIPKGTKINEQHIHDNIGISKDYNIFELQNALANHDILKVNKINNYFAANPKEHPFLATLAGLNSWFLKIFSYHGLADKSKDNIAKTLKIHPFFVADYQKAARAYPGRKVANIICMLNEYSMKSRGVNNNTTSHSELLKELLFKILH